MTNDIATAKKWTEFVAGRPEFSAGRLLLEQFEMGEITDICGCGCNSYSMKPADNVSVPPLVPPGEGGGASFLMEFESVEPNGTLEFILHTDSAGNLDGMDVHFNANSEPVPEMPYHVHGQLSRKA